MKHSQDLGKRERMERAAKRSLKKSEYYKRIRKARELNLDRSSSV